MKSGIRHNKSLLQSRRTARWLAAGLILLLALAGRPSVAAQSPGLSPYYGLNFVQPAEPWLALARQSGAGVVRWQFNWRDIEPSRGNWNWGVTDGAIRAWNNAGLSIHAILHNPPDDAKQNPTGLVPTNIHLPWDHPDNRWGHFCNEFAARYRGQIGSYEIWNEPDLDSFWEGTPQEYYYVLRSCYMGIRAADPSTPISMAGMAMLIEPEFFPELLSIIVNDPNAAANNYYFDVANVHMYVSPELVYSLTLDMKRTLSLYGLGSKPVWITETNIPLRGAGIAPDYPFWRYATQDEAAWYVLQAASNAYAAGADKLMFFRLADDGMEEAFGLVGGDGQIRPSYQALQLATTIMRDIVEAQREVRSGVVITTLRRADGARIVTMYSVTGVTVDLKIPAEKSAGVLINAVGGHSTIEPGEDGSYTVTLLPARGRNLSRLEDYSVGGPPLVIVEYDDEGPLASLSAETLPDDATRALVRWQGDDGEYGTGVSAFDVEVSQNGGTWFTWRSQTTDVEGIYDLSGGGTYAFRVRATDNAGNLGNYSEEASVKLVGRLDAQIVNLRGQPVPFARVELADGSLHDADASGHIILETTQGSIEPELVDGSAHGTLHPPPVEVTLGEVVSVTWALRPSQNLLDNGNFERNLRDWTLTAQFDGGIVDLQTEQGKVLRLHGGRRPWGAPGASTVVDLPGQMTDAVLSFAYRMPVADQRLRVRLVTADGQQVTVWQTGETTLTFERVSVDIGAFAGQTVDLRFELWGEKGVSGTAEIDDVIVTGVPK